MKQSETPYLTGKDVQDLLKISRTTLYRLTKEKKLKCKKVRGANRYKQSDIEKMMK
jgi:excisionase family DNA binding protein